MARKFLINLKNRQTFGESRDTPNAGRKIIQTQLQRNVLFVDRDSIRMMDKQMPLVPGNVGSMSDDQIRRELKNANLNDTGLPAVISNRLRRHLEGQRVTPAKAVGQTTPGTPGTATQPPASTTPQTNRNVSPCGSAAKMQQQMRVGLLLGDVVPDFVAETQNGPLNFYTHIDGSWAIMFSHPGDFTPVCTTELGMLARLMPEFESRGVKVLALSCDNGESHKR